MISSSSVVIFSCRALLYISVRSLISSLAASVALDGGSLLTALPRITWRGWGAVIFLAWACSALGYVLWYRGLQRQKVSQVSVLQYFQPLVATLLGVVLLGESVIWATAIGGVMILGGVALVNRGQ